ncbi:TetR/AcrR family transcriptional regulator [Glycomyces tenuis]|uniref:TetR/AcrR family transcriptional regulator n=1 Tax=Glycomyces tenuis TaxID=58116 RepID=UPI000416CFB0|nr:TetR/AcrR family transcriptional regulator [Glycomyces tenuis]
MSQEGRTRRRGKELERAIFEATWAELQEGGFAAVTMERVAKRAGTSKPVLYRRWSSRVELLVNTALHRLPDADSVPDGGTLRDDTVNLLKLMRQRLLSIGREPMLGILTEVVRNPEVNKKVFRHLIGHLRALMTDVVLKRAAERGEIEPEDLNERLKTLPFDLVRSEFILTGAVPDEAIEEIVDTVFLPALAGRKLLRREARGPADAAGASPPERSGGPGAGDAPDLV